MILMVRKRVLVIFSLLCCVSFFTRAETPPLGPFTDYFFIDRWGQGVFGSLFVDPGCFQLLSEKGWHPLKVDAEISGWQGVVIQKIRSVSVLPDPKLNIRLTVDSPTVAYRSTTKLKVEIKNVKKLAHELYRRDLYLAIAISERGTIPEGVVERDEIFDVFSNTVDDFEWRTLYSRAENSVPLLTDQGMIVMENGWPMLQIFRDGKTKKADLYDEDFRTLASGESLTFEYEIGTGWLINEYELTARYRYEDASAEGGMKSVMSMPMSFDVVLDK